MKKTILIAASMLALSGSIFAQEASKPQFKLYGFIRNFFAYDTRESVAGTDDLFYYMPKNESLTAAGLDENASSSFRFGALTSRIGLDVTGYEFDGFKMGAKIETDFYSGLTGNSGTAQLRLRQAYVTVAKNNHSWKIGQAWHPMAADMPDIYSLETGAPFGAFSRTPQVAYDWAFADRVVLNTAAIWQMQYTSAGPEGASANYVKYGSIPEFYAGLTFKGEKAGNLLRVGVDATTIMPYRYTVDGKNYSNSLLTSCSVFAYGQASVDDFVIKSKLIYGQDGSHYNLIGGYGICDITEKGEVLYSPTQTINWWASVAYKTKSRWQPSVFFGYVNNLGTTKPVYDSYYKLNASSVAQLFRIQPEIVYNLGKLQLGAEYMLTGVQYGKKNDGSLLNPSYLVPTEDLKTLVNHRIQLLVKFNF